MVGHTPKNKTKSLLDLKFYVEDLMKLPHVSLNGDE